MDYLLSAVTHLTQDTPPGDRDLKYAVLHLHAATEVLLKARLARVHWSLVFANPAKATKAAFDTGGFSSATLDGTIERLSGIAGIDLREADRQAITKLGKTRNAFTHYGHRDTAYAIEGQAIDVLNFLLDFIERFVYDREASSQFGEEYDQTMHSIRERLGRIESLVKDRMHGVAAEVGEFADRTVHCPACRQMAIVVGEPDLRCRFCNAKWDAPTELATHYLIDVLGVDNGGLDDCPICRDESRDYAKVVVLGAATASDRLEDVGVCFSCGLKFVPLTKPSPVDPGVER
ncbi:hypothetical protein ACIP9H_33935 [Streptomyces sp. NPDC088732]|uniref:hypothetical protein n=1 Tax=Streptomyces sp. NPDC088732 TaxID=3365879 RepID=UPI0038207A37